MSASQLDPGRAYICLSARPSTSPTQVGHALVFLTMGATVLQVHESPPQPGVLPRQRIKSFLGYGEDTTTLCMSMDDAAQARARTVAPPPAWSLTEENCSWYAEKVYEHVMPHVDVQSVSRRFGYRLTNPYRIAQWIKAQRVTRPNAAFHDSHSLAVALGLSAPRADDRQTDDQNSRRWKIPLTP